MSDPLSRKPLTKADKTVKTVESWWAFGKAAWEDWRPFFGPFFAGWTVTGSAFSSVFGWIASYGWAGIVLAVIAGFMATCIAVMLGAGAWYAALVARDRRRPINALAAQVGVPTPAAMLTGPAEANATSAPGPVQELATRLDALTQTVADHDSALLAAEEQFKGLGYAGEAGKLSLAEERLLPLFELHERRLDKLREQADRNAENHRSLHDRIAAIAELIDGRSSEADRAIKALQQRAESDRGQLATSIHMLVTSLRARDAEAIFKDADGKVLHFGAKLLDSNNDDYIDDRSWLEGYTAWKAYLGRIDELVSQWEEGFKPFLGISASELESGALPPPARIVASSDANSVRFKTVWLAQTSYTNRRDGILRYFDRKARELPG